MHLVIGMSNASKATLNKGVGITTVIPRVYTRYWVLNFNNDFLILPPTYRRTVSIHNCAYSTHELL